MMHWQGGLLHFLLPVTEGEEGWKTPIVASGIVTRVRESLESACSRSDLLPSVSSLTLRRHLRVGGKLIGPVT
jgi:hypothetical protein